MLTKLSRTNSFSDSGTSSTFLFDKATRLYAEARNLANQTSLKPQDTLLKAQLDLKLAELQIRVYKKHQTRKQIDQAERGVQMSHTVME